VDVSEIAQWSISKSQKLQVLTPLRQYSLVTLCDFAGELIQTQMLLEKLACCRKGLIR
jgi:hypothetical protein